MLCGDVEGLDGTRAAVDVPADLLDRCTVWAIGARNMAGVQLDLAGTLALQALLNEAASRLRKTASHEAVEGGTAASG
jgi:hypothetical protein